jgi:malonyl-CoA/methylmalonyl-CoA synthetase
MSATYVLAPDRHLPPGMVDPDLLAAGSLTNSWLDHWRADGARTVVHDAKYGWVTAAELEERSRDIAHRLAGAGLSFGDRVVMSAAASLDLVVAHIAALRMGAIVIPTNTAYREREFLHVVRDSTPSVVLTDDVERASWVRADGSDAVVVGVEVDLPAAKSCELDVAGIDDPALIAYTSGTTGTPKGAVLTHGNLLASAEALRLAWRWQPDDRLILALPLFHLHGLGVGLHGTLTAGASIVVRPRFDVRDVLDQARHHRASLFFGVPTMYRRILESGAADELASLRLCVSGSAPLSAADHVAVASASGQHIIERYGMTETVITVSNPYDGDRRPGTVGFPLPGVEARLADDTNEIQLRGPSVMAGYWQRPDATREVFVGSGWISTGDIGAIDEFGYLSIVGRSKELIISGGYNVYPREIEDVLRNVPGVVDVAVVGKPHVEWGEQVVAFVVADGVTEQQLRDFAATQLASYKQPKLVRFVDGLPRNEMGKVLKQQLTEAT